MFMFDVSVPVNFFTPEINIIHKGVTKQFYKHIDMYA